jgi:predicted RNA binding protein YcfA (HicA-like mRNA interferase family)
MPKLKNLSGKEVLESLEYFGFSVIKRKGSHVKLRRIIDGIRQTLTIPDHKELDKGTLKAIYLQAGRYISQAELRKYFYSE